MEATSSRTTRSSGPVLRSLSPSNKQSETSSWSSATSSFSSNFASSSSSLTSSKFFRRSTSPTRVNLYRSPPQNLVPSVRFSLERSVSPRRTITVTKPRDNQVVKKSCMCSPTTHPGSFRCSLHKHLNNIRGYTTSYSSNGLNLQRSAMKNSLVRIGTVEGDLVKRTLAALIRPSSHQQRRRSAFRPRPSRLSTMSKADDL